MFQPVAQGALPTLFAAMATGAQPGRYDGPDRLGETREHPTLANVPPKAENRDVAPPLWNVSQD